MEKSAVSELEKSLKKCSSVEEFSRLIGQAKKLLDESVQKSKPLVHVQLCRVFIQCTNDLISYNNEHTNLLLAMGHVTALEIISGSISTASDSGSKWLETVLLDLLKNGSLDTVLREQCRHGDSDLTTAQKNLINSLCRYPDLLAAKRGRQISDQLLPVNYFSSLAGVVFNCLNCIYTSVRGAITVAFLSYLIGKASFLGHRESFYTTLCPKLEEVVKEESSNWRILCHELFCHVPQHYLEATLDGLFQYKTNCLLQKSLPLWCLIGDLPLKSAHAKYLCTHKYVAVRPLSDARVLVEYLAGSESLKPVLVEAIIQSLKLWSDKSCLRHMTNSLHQYLSEIIVLGINYVGVQSQLSEFKGLVMQGVQIHLECPVDETKYTGMVVGEFLMNHLYPSSEPLQFTYPTTDSIDKLKSLMRPICDQEKDRKPCSTNTIKKEAGAPSIETREERYGRGLVHTSNESDSDDDDLEPYDMSNDRDSNLAPPPRYLRTCIEGLLAKNDPAKQTAALREVPKLIKARRPDLSEVCLELAKILLHLEDTHAMEDFTQQRHESLVELTHTCPAKVAPYLCEQFYSPHYTIRHRVDILEVLTGAALKLSTPSADAVKERSVREPFVHQKKTWQQVVDERIKAKTRYISKGGSVRRKEGATNQFNGVCGYFFFPLMAGFDSNIPTLDLSGRDSMLLGQLLNTLGTVIHLSSNCQLVPVMATTLLDFCWSFKYHTDVSVRRGVLYCVCCILSVIHVSSISMLMEKGLDEMLLWIKDVISDDASQECRQLADLCLLLFSECTRQQQKS